MIFMIHKTGKNHREHRGIQRKYLEELLANEKLN